MTAPAASLHTARRAPWALWTTLLAMLLAVQVSAGTIRPAALVETGAVAAKLTLPLPLAAQFRDTGHALKAAGQRPNAARPGDGHDGAAPPLLALSAAVAAPILAADPLYTRPGAAPRSTVASGANRARAPPLA
jgi:hypothetical protein